VQVPDGYPGVYQLERARRLQRQYLARLAWETRVGRILRR
jgi:hypothetical protein